MDYQNGSLWVYEILKQNGIRALFYSGDTDASVPTTGSKKWIEGLGWDVVSPWRQWFITDDAQVSGYVVDYDGLTFVTIKGVGHMSIQWKRPQGYHVFTNFLNNQRI